jgi:hypothetical protein
MSGEARETETLEQSLARLEKLTAALEGIADGTGREAARELLALVLDLHARSVARLSAIIAASDDGAAMLEKIVEDRPLAILLLHGLASAERGGSPTGCHHAHAAARRARAPPCESHERGKALQWFSCKGMALLNLPTSCGWKSRTLSPTLRPTSTIF